MQYYLNLFEEVRYFDYFLWFVLVFFWPSTFYSLEHLNSGVWEKLMQSIISCFSLCFRSQESEVWFSVIYTFCVLFWFWILCHHLKPCAALGFRGLKTYYSYKLLINVIFLKGKFIFLEKWIYEPSNFKRWVCNRNKEECRIPEVEWSFLSTDASLLFLLFLCKPQKGIKYIFILYFP